MHEIHDDRDDTFEFFLGPRDGERVHVGADILTTATPIPRFIASKGGSGYCEVDVEAQPYRCRLGRFPRRDALG